MRLFKFTLILILSTSLGIFANNTATAAPHKSSGHGKSKRHALKKTGSGNVWDRIRAGIRIPRPNPSSGGYHFIHVRLPNETETGGAAISNPTEVSTPVKETDLLKHSSQLREKFRIRHIITPQQSSQPVLESAPQSNYTELGRRKLLKKQQAEIVQSNDLLKTEVIEPNAGIDHLASSTRIRTKLNVNSQAIKKAAKSNLTSHETLATVKPVLSANQGPIRSCGDLSNQALIHQAEIGVLTESYNQMVEQCRRKQSDNSARISKHITGYSSGYLYQVALRARPYLYHIVDTLSKYNVPLDIALLPIVESAFQATALSPKSAAGIWQFIPSTGLEYGLDQNEFYDGRLDPAASTLAAVRFLSGLNGHFKGDWLLTLAAYNSGQGTVDAAINRNRAEGLDTDFWSLDLPAETKEYVPRLLALSTLFANPGAYGLTLPVIRNEPYFIKVTIDNEHDIDQLHNKNLKTVARLGNCPTDDFLLLNSAYVNQSLTKREPYHLLMPVNSANLLHQNLAYTAWAKLQATSMEQMIVETNHTPLFERYHVDTPLLTLGDKYVSNSVFDRSPITFRISQQAPPINKNSQAEFLATHYVEQGETLKSLAQTHDVSEEKIRELNKLKRKASIAFGQKLLIPFRPVGETTKKHPPSILFKASEQNKTVATKPVISF